MALPADYITGTITLTNGSVDFTGTDTGWLAADFREGDTIPYVAGGESFAPPIIQSITSNTAGTLTTPWAGPTLTGVAYRMRYQWDSSRVSAQTRTMIEQLGNGNLQSISALTGPGVLVFDGPHSTVVRPETDFINGVAYDVQVDTLADRAAYDGQAAGFAVLVSDVGDGRSALYTKNTNTSGDWSDPAYITGPVGPLPVLQVGDTTTLPPGSDATVNIVPVTGGYELDFGIPEGEGFNWAGVYNIANAYVQDDVVRHNGSAFIAIQAVPAGNSPSSVFPPVDTAFWAVLAAKGQDGTGTGDVVGPAVAVDSAPAQFDGTTGKLLKAGAFATQPIAAGGTDTTAFMHSLAVRQGIIGAGALPIATTPTTPDWNNIINPGWHPDLAQGSGANGPGSSAYFFVFVLNRSGILTQYAYPYGNSITATSGAITWQRGKDATSTWTPWRPVAAPLTGTVSHTGGVPTGAIIEQGTNTNGNYTRFADGTQIVYGGAADGVMTASVATGGGFQSAALYDRTFPVAFSAPPFVTPVPFYFDGGGGRGWATVSSRTSTGTSLIGHGFSSGSQVFGTYIAVGRWF